MDRSRACWQMLLVCRFSDGSPEKHGLRVSGWDWLPAGSARAPATGPAGCCDALCVAADCLHVAGFGSASPLAPVDPAPAWPSFDRWTEGHVAAGPGICCCFAAKKVLRETCTGIAASR